MSTTHNHSGDSGESNIPTKLDDDKQTKRTHAMKTVTFFITNIVTTYMYRIDLQMIDHNYSSEDEDLNLITVWRKRVAFNILYNFLAVNVYKDRTIKYCAPMSILLSKRLAPVKKISK